MDNANLKKALSFQFSDDEAECLATILSCGLGSFSYREIDIDDKIKDDMILLAVEERVILPMKSLRGSAWDDRILNFADDELYHIPRVVGFLVEEAQRSGEWNTKNSVAKALEEAGEDQVDMMVDYLSTIKERASKCEVEVGVMQVIGEAMGLKIDMHDTLDRFVRCGIMSPKTQQSLHTGFSKYEMNPSLYWNTK